MMRLLEKHNLFRLGAMAVLLWAGLVLAGPVLGQDEPVDEKSDAENVFDERRFVRHHSGTDTCLVCHGQYNPVVKTPTEPRHSLWIDKGLFYQSAHVKDGCQGCHTNIDKYGHRMSGIERMPQRCSPCHDEEAATPQAPETSEDTRRAAFEQMLIETGFSPVEVTTLQACHNCHPQEFAAYAESVHGALSLSDPQADTPTCIDCHGSHGILPASDERSLTNPANVPATCLRCHDQVEIKARAGLEREIGESFKSSFHGRRGELGDKAVAVCTNCHGVHLIFPSTDPRSKVNALRIAKTCGECHEGAQLNFASAFTHKVVNPQEQLGLYILKQIYKWVIFLLIAQFVLFAGLDIFQTYRHKLKKRKEAPHA